MGNSTGRKKRRPDRRRIKIHRNYTVDEAARLVGKQNQTVLRWIKSGKLPALKDQRPMLILGQDLVDYLKSRAKPKFKYKLHECHCFTCKRPREPAFRAIEYIPTTPTSGRIRALCKDCGTLMYKGYSESKLEALGKNWDVTIMEASPHLMDSPSPPQMITCHRSPKPMRKHHPKNERIKRAYFIYLEEAKRMATSSVDQIAAHLAAFEASTKYKDFKLFRIDQARQFKRMLREHINPTTGKPLAKATINSRLKALRAFFQWLSQQPGYRSELKYTDAEYFNDTHNNQRIARAIRFKPVPAIELIRQVLESMPVATDIEKRNRALIAFTLLGGARDSAIASLSLKHVDIEKRTVFQDAREVRTKNRKTIQSIFFPVGDDMESIVAEWIGTLINDHQFGLDDPLFPVTEVGLGPDMLFGATGLGRSHWASAQAIRKIFKEAFEGAGLPYYNPHSFRHTLARLGEKICRTPEEFKAWSQNLGHEKVLTTFTNYGAVANHRQADILNGMAKPASADQATSEMDDQTIAAVLAKLKS